MNSFDGVTVEYCSHGLLFFKQNLGFFIRIPRPPPNPGPQPSSAPQTRKSNTVECYTDDVFGQRIRELENFDC